MAKKLTTHGIVFIGVHKVCEYNTKRRLGVSKYDEQAKKMIAVSATPITHEVHLSCNNFGNSVRSDLAHPDQEFGLWINLGSGAAVGRPGSSNCLFYDNEIYFVLTWTDVLGSGHTHQSGLRRNQCGRLIYFLQKVVDPDHKQFLTDLIANELNI